MEPTSFAELRAGCYDIDERVKDMDANGVLGSLCFPSFPQFCGQLLRPHRGQGRRAGDGPGLQRLAHRGLVRHAPRPVHPVRRSRSMWDPQVLADEVRRTARMGAHAVTFSENPSKLG